MAAKKSWSPRSFPVRDPRNARQQNGRIINPPRALKFGGVGELTLFSSHPPTKRGTAGPNGVGPVSDRGSGGR
jgi:hypothetical protein